jgi:hypothetical protein
MLQTSVRLTLFMIALVCAAAGAQERGVVRVTAARASIRAEPAETAAVLEQVPAGSVFELAAVQGDWFRILLPADPRLRGARVTGYLSRKFAEQVSGTEAATAKPQARQMSMAPVGAGVKIGVDIAGKSVWLPASPVRAVALPARAASLSQAAAAAVFQGDQGLPAAAESVVTWVWGVAPGGSPVTLPAGRPSFFVAYTDLPGLNPNDFLPALVRLVPGTQDWRVASMAGGRADARSRDATDWVIARDLNQDVVPSTIEGSGPGIVQLRPTASLTPGDYAIVLRPAFARGYSGRELLGDEGAGAVFNAAWKIKIR